MDRSMRCSGQGSAVVMCAYQRGAYQEFFGILSTSFPISQKASLISAGFVDSLEVGILPMELCRPPFVKPT
jgi:hypothetical protein